MKKCKPTDTPIATGTKLSKKDEGTSIDYTLYKRLVGILMSLTAIRPFIMYAVSLILRFMEYLKISHWKVGKRFLRYIVGTIDYGIWYSNSEDDSLVGYTDSDFSGSVDDKKINLVYAFMFDTSLISWDSKKQPIITIYSAEEDYVGGSLVIFHMKIRRHILYIMTTIKQLHYLRIMCFTARPNTLILAIISSTRLSTMVASCQLFLV